MSAFNKPKEEPSKGKPFLKGKPLLKQIKGMKLGFKLNLDVKSPMDMLPYFLYLTLLGVIYIANNYYYEKLYIRIVGLEKEVEDMRVDYSTQKYEYIYMSKRSEIARRVAWMGLHENDGDVYRVYIDK